MVNDRLRTNIIRALFIDNKPYLTEVSLKYSGKEYSVGSITNQDIINTIVSINQSKLFKPIKFYYNSYNVLSISVSS